MKDKILDKISAKEPLEILRRLAENDPNIAQQIESEAEQLLKKVDLKEICEDVFFVLDGIDVKELWDRSGASRYGYSSWAEWALKI